MRCWNVIYVYSFFCDIVDKSFYHVLFFCTWKIKILSLKLSHKWEVKFENISDKHILACVFRVDILSQMEIVSNETIMMFITSILWYLRKLFWFLYCNVNCNGNDTTIFILLFFLNHFHIKFYIWHTESVFWIMKKAEWYTKSDG